MATAHLKKIVGYHKKARSAIYPADLVDRVVTRVQVPDDKVPLDVSHVGQILRANLGGAWIY